MASAALATRPPVPWQMKSIGLLPLCIVLLISCICAAIDKRCIQCVAFLRVSASRDDGPKSPDHLDDLAVHGPAVTPAH